MTQTKHWVFVGGYAPTIETFAFDPKSGTLTSTGLTEGVAEAPTFLASGLDRLIDITNS